MKHIIIISSLILICASSHAQSFEGKLTYKVDFEFNEEKLSQLGVTKEIMLNKLKEKEEFLDETILYFKEGNYIKEQNFKIQKRSIYKAEENMLYIFENGSDYVTIMNAKNPNGGDWKFGNTVVKISEPDTTKIIHGKTCNLVKLNSDNLVYQYNWYSKEEIKINSDLFKQHNYEHLNSILEITDSYPMEITLAFGFMSMKMTIKEIEEIELDERMFLIPELKKSKRKSDKLIEEMTGNKVMKIKN